MVTPNRIVGRRLELARRARGWTQTELGQRLADVTGREWSKAVISAAERSWRAPRVRQFTADEIVAFAHVTGFPVPWFFLEDDELWESGEGVSLRGDDGDDAPDDGPLVDVTEVVFPKRPPSEYEQALAVRGRSSAVGLVGRQADLTGWLHDLTERWERGISEAREVVATMHDYDDSKAAAALREALAEQDRTEEER